MSPQGCGTSGPTAAVIVAAIWDELLAGHTVAGSFGKRLKDAVGLDTLTAAKVAFVDAAITGIPNSIWDNVMTGHATADSFGKRLKDAVGLDSLTAAKVAFLDENISAAKQKKITKTTGTFTAANSVAKQTILEITTNDELVTVSLDCVNLTQITTIGVEEKIDGTNYQIIQTVTFPTDFTGEGVVISLDGKGRDQKITMTSTILEGATRDVYHARVEELRTT